MKAIKAWIYDQWRRLVVVYIFADPLTISISPTNDNVIQGTSKTIACIITGSPQPNPLIWTRLCNGKSEIIDLSLTNKFSGGTLDNPSLTINNFTDTDTGSYMCKVTNSVSTVSSEESALTLVRKFIYYRSYLKNCYSIDNAGVKSELTVYNFCYVIISYV